MTTTQRYLLYFSYIGTSFSGSQILNCGTVSNIRPSVQGYIEKGFCWLLQLTGFRPIRIYVCSRTDAGVHAIKNAAHVDLPVKEWLTPEIIQCRLNQYFFRHEIEISISDVIKVPESFSRKSVIEKTYLYRIGVLRNELADKYKFLLPITEYKRTYFVRKHIFEFEKAKEVLNLFVGEKDFGALVARPSKYTKSTICNIKSFHIEKAHPLMSLQDPVAERFHFYQFQCTGNRFLPHMVRRMVGAALSVASNRVPFEKAQNLIENPVASSWMSCFFTLPGYGLYLLKVTYNPEDLIIKEEESEQKELQVLESAKTKSETKVIECT